MCSMHPRTSECTLAHYQSRPPTLIAVLAASSISTVTEVGAPLVFTLTAVLTQAFIAKIIFRWTAYTYEYINISIKAAQH